MCFIFAYLIITENVRIIFEEVTMEALQLDSKFKTYFLSFDEPHMSSMSGGHPLTYKQGDQIVVTDSETVQPGLILVSTSLGVRLCRYELRNGVGALNPPLNLLNQNCIILGQVTNHPLHREDLGN
jgi:SOS-response transcriptional repressor LexA